MAVLLAPEGINIFLAGSREAIDGIVGWLTLPTNHPNTAGSINSANQPIMMTSPVVFDRRPTHSTDCGSLPVVVDAVWLLFLMSLPPSTR